MEPPTCVVDASTLVEHIQEIKRWVQQGRLRLVVPLCTMENVKQRWYKDITDRQEAAELALQLPKWAGKPSRREHPTYDNNPRVTVQFLDRLRVENDDGLVFQLPGEEYPPWQRVQIPPEEQVQEKRPATFAEAVRHKLNATNGTSEASSATKVPAKAKLVARASATDMSPWRVNKSAPRLLAGSVPVRLRPLLSYTLWRLYEELSSPAVGNSCILLTNDAATYDIAQGLTIKVKTIPEIRQLIASQTLIEDVDSFGELEREFGRREPVAKQELGWRQLRPKVSKVNDDNVLDCSTGDQNGDIDKPGDQIIIHPIKNGDLTLKATEAEVPEVKSNISYMEELPVVSDNRKSVQEWLPKAGSAVHATRIEDPEQTEFNSMSHEKTVDTSCHFEVASTPLEKETTEKPENSILDTPCHFEVASTPLEKETTKKPENSIAPNSQPADSQVNEWQAKKDVIDTPIMTSDVVTNEAPAPRIMDTGVLGSAYLSPERKPVFPQEAEPQNRHCSSPSGASSGSMPCSPRLSSETNSLSTTEAQEQEDSDEEVVVFNPRAKRWSSQSKPIKDVSQPTSPAKTLNPRNLASAFESPPRKGSSHQVPVTPSPPSQAQTSPLPRNQTPRNQTSGQQASRDQVYPDQTHSDQGLRNHSPRKNSPRNRSPRNQAQRKQGQPNQTPQNRAPPAIIDPDFFGRSPVVNIKPNGQNGQGRYFHRGSPRRGPRGHEADVEYVLTSGATREATRGKGKLWVP